jgi:hypothetical protein
MKIILIQLIMTATLLNQTNTMNAATDSLQAGKIIKTGKIIYSEIQINASAAQVWQAFTAFEEYGQWNPFIKSLKGHPKIDKKIEVFLQPEGQKGMLFKPTVLVFEEQKEFRWIGQFIIPRLFDGEHCFQLKELPDGSCMFIQYERFRGLLVPFLKKMLEGSTLKGFQAMNQKLKERVEDKL